MPRVFLQLLVGLGLAATPCFASGTSDLTAARQLFEQGREQQDRQEWAKASALYKKAIEIKDTPGLRYRLGYCEQKLGHLVEAGVEFQRAQELIESGVDAKDVAELLPVAQAELTKRTPRVQLSLSNVPTGLVLEIDNRMVSTDPLREPILLNPGQHTIRLAAPNHQPATEQLELAEGEQRTLEIALNSTTSTTPTPNALETAGTGPSTAKVIVLAGETALIAGGLSIGIAFAQKRKNAERSIDRLLVELDEAEGGGGTCNSPYGASVDLCRRLARTHDERRQASLTSNAAFITAGVGTAAALLTYFIWPDSGSTEVSLSVAPDESLLWWSGNF
jgi:tetratricopeptide (TPR) repeat protein